MLRFEQIFSTSNPKTYQKYLVVIYPEHSRIKRNHEGPLRIKLFILLYFIVMLN
jgi:hypothetical protein